MIGKILIKRVTCCAVLVMLVSCEKNHPVDKEPAKPVATNNRAGELNEENELQKFLLGSWCKSKRYEEFERATIVLRKGQVFELDIKSPEISVNQTGQFTIRDDRLILSCKNGRVINVAYASEEDKLTLEFMNLMKASTVFIEFDKAPIHRNQ